MEHWDDVRVFHALVQHGTVRAAATALGVNHTTVSRRLKALEERLGSRLVERTSDGYVPTEAGQVLMDAAQRVERDLATAAQRVEGAQHRLSGTVRLAMTDLGRMLAAPVLTRLATDHPDLRLELRITSAEASLSAPNTDLCLRLCDAPPPDRIGRKLGTLRRAVYGAAGLGLKPHLSDLASVPWIRWGAPWVRARHETWIDTTYPGARCTIRVDSYSALQHLVTEGAGVALLSPWTASLDPELVRLTAPIQPLSVDLWLLIDPEQRAVRPVKSVADAFSASIPPR